MKDEIIKSELTTKPVRTEGISQKEIEPERKREGKNEKSTQRKGHRVRKPKMLRRLVIKHGHNEKEILVG